MFFTRIVNRIEKGSFSCGIFFIDNIGRFQQQFKKFVITSTCSIMHGSTMFDIFDNNFCFFVYQNSSNQLILAVMERRFQFTVPCIERKPFIDEILCKNVKILFHCDVQSCSFHIVHSWEQILFVIVRDCWD